jgi:hypothetical protein
MRCRSSLWGWEASPTSRDVATQKEGTAGLAGSATVSTVRSEAQVDAAHVVDLYVRRLRARAAVLYGVRAACAALGAGSLCLVLTGGMSGPVVTPLFARSALAGLGLIGVAILFAGLWPLAALRGAGGWRLLTARDPTLASRVRSALELRSGVGSPELVAAHARGVRDAVGALPISEVVPLDWLRHATVIAGIGCAVLSALLIAGSETVRSGAYALLHPAQMRADGLRVAPVVAAVSARLVYPSYLAMKPVELSDPTRIEAPRGTTVELLVRPRLTARQGMLAVAGSQVRMSAAPNGRLFARFVVRESTPLGVRVFSDDHWYEDSEPRSVRAIEDKKPEVSLQAPDSGTTIEAQESVSLRWKASDDHGLSSLDLVLRAQNGEEHRRRLWSSLSAADKSQRNVEDETLLVPAELGAQPGDVLLAWLEARDSDVVSGPNVGISKTISFEIATGAQRISLRLPRLREVLDGALGSLGDRLETTIPNQDHLAQQRFEELREGADGWLTGLQALIAEGRQQNGSEALDVEQLQGVYERTRRELGREAALYRTGAHSDKQRSEADGHVVSEHEHDTLLLADMLAQGLVDEARALTQELADLKNHIGDLLKQLKAHKSPEAERELLAEIAKAQRRLRELAQSLARLSNRVPSEFINREALPQSDAKSSLDEMRAAVEAGDLDSAERQLQALNDQIDDLTKNIDSGGARFREAHFGPRDQAMAEARKQLGTLAAEQNRLADRSHEVVKRAAERAKSRDGASGPSGEMQRSADEIERDIDALRDSSPGSAEAPWLERARDRMRDAADAMRTGDMAEARRMSAAADSSLDQAASSLDQDARMFPGHNGETRQRAQSANNAANKLRQLQKQLDQAMPQLGQFVGDPERKQMSGDVDPQRGARRKAEELQDQMSHGPDGTPLSPDGERSMQSAAEAMKRAERALERGDPQSAALAQQDASEQLRQLDEQLARKGQGKKQPGGPGGEQDRGGGGNGPIDESPVRIPGADEFSGPVQMRRKLLDAMREQAPPEFKSSVARYYEELLR